MMHCKISRYLNNGICLGDMQKCVKENCNQWQPYTNYDRIRNMSVEELAEFLRNFVTEALTNPKCIVVEKWLESEVQGNE